MELWFYHLERSAAEDVLPGLLEKSLERGWRAHVRFTDPARLKVWDQLLWTYRPESFLPHGAAGGAHDADQPVLLGLFDPPANAPQIEFLLDRARPSGAEGLARTVLLFDGGDEDALADARARWKEAKAEGAHALAYWKQEPTGKWAKAG